MKNMNTCPSFTIQIEFCGLKKFGIQIGGIILILDLVKEKKFLDI
jgi:hypothetical protein